jgi:hypothetical protein
MADLFADLLDYIAKTIIQLLIMKAIMSGSSFLGGFFGAPAKTTTAASAAPASFWEGGGVGGLGGGPVISHTGGVPGVDPLPVRIANPAIFENARRLHNGLRSNEFPAILQRGEGVFTEGQMRALGQRLNEGRGVTVNVPVNVAGDDKLLASKLRSNIEAVVLKTLREEMR